jgi:hypothetical protein
MPNPYQVHAQGMCARQASDRGPTVQRRFAQEAKETLPRSPVSGRPPDNRRKLLRLAISSLRCSLERFLLDVYGQAGARHDPELIGRAVGQWYASIPRASARLIQQEMMGSTGGHKAAAAPIREMIQSLASICYGSLYKSEPLRAAENLVLTLFQLKVTGSFRSTTHELRYIDQVVTHWLRVTC